MSQLPEGARLEAILAPGIALYDVSHLLPRDRRARNRTKSIKYLFFHHSGFLGKPGWRGILASARFTTRKVRWVLVKRGSKHVRVNKGGRGYWSFPYHYWIPRTECRDSEGRRVMFRGCEDELRSPHTKSPGGRLNQLGVSCALQGNTNTKPPSEHQFACLEAFAPWALERYGIPAKNISMHCESGNFGGNPKKTCPGHGAAGWLRGFRSALV